MYSKEGHCYILQPYLHESRHVHALKRARGSGGRFLNMKKLQGSKPNSTSHRVDVSGSAQLHLTGNMSEPNVHEADNYRDGASTTSCSDITSTSNSIDIFPRQDFRFSGYPSHMGGTLQVPLVDFHGGGNQQHVSIFRWTVNSAVCILMFCWRLRLLNVVPLPREVILGYLKLLFYCFLTVRVNLCWQCFNPFSSNASMLEELMVKRYIVTENMIFLVWWWIICACADNWHTVEEIYVCEDDTFCVFVQRIAIDLV